MHYIADTSERDHIFLKKVEAGGHTYRPFWNIFKTKRPGFSKYRQDATYNCLTTQPLDHIEWLCEIGSDMGRSTAWLSNIAQNIDVYEQDTRYIDICRGQCYSHQLKYGPIRNVNWHEVEDISISKVIDTLPRKYDAIKVSGINVIRYVPSMFKKLNKGGYLILDELYRGEQTKENLVKMLQYNFEMTSNRWDSTIIVAKHK